MRWFVSHCCAMSAMHMHVDAVTCIFFCGDACRLVYGNTLPLVHGARIRRSLETVYSLIDRLEPATRCRARTGSLLLSCGYPSCACDSPRESGRGCVGCVHALINGIQIAALRCGASERGGCLDLIFHPFALVRILCLLAVGCAPTSYTPAYFTYAARALIATSYILFLVTGSCVLSV